MGSSTESGWLLVESERKEEAYKLVIAASLGMAGLGVLLACLSVPALLSYSAHMRAFSEVDLDFCRSSHQELSLNLERAQGAWARAANDSSVRHKRYEPPNALPSGAFGGQLGGQVLLATGFGFQECPACCVPGVRGPSGDPGLPGMHGAPGPDGSSGRPGVTPNASCIPERIFEPPPCLPCPQGPRGQPGHPGFPGEGGYAGGAGRPGNGGLDGPPGGPGVQGPPGPRGAPGAQGDAGYTPEAKVISGPPGDAGDPGPWGLPGHPGLTGGSGFPGTPGERGWPGPPGDPGLLGPRGVAGPTGEAGPPGTPGTCVCQETEVVIEDAAQNAYDLNKAGRVPTANPGPPASAPLPPIIPDYPDELEAGAFQPEDTFLPVLDAELQEYYDDAVALDPDYFGGDVPPGPFSPGAPDNLQTNPEDFFKWAQAPDLREGPAPGQEAPRAPGVSPDVKVIGLSPSPGNPPKAAQSWGRGQ